MKPKKLLGALTVGLLAIAPVSASAQGAAPETGGAPSSEAKTQTIANLVEATRGEANAAHRYDLFAERADEEGYREVASLFRAAALSERVHRRNHEEVLRSLGVPPPTVRLEQVAVGTTQENLRGPIQGERKETEQIYPRFARQAEQAGIPAAALTFR